MTPLNRTARASSFTKSHMYTEASLDLERCIFKIDAQSRTNWVSAHVIEIDHIEDVSSPHIIIREDAMHEDTGRADRHTRQAELPPSGNGIQAPTRGTTKSTASEGLATSQYL